MARFKRTRRRGSLSNIETSLRLAIRQEQEARKKALAEGSWRFAKPKRKTSTEIWITVGANCPWNTTPGVRQVHCFKSAEEAHAAGFTDVKPRNILA